MKPLEPKHLIQLGEFAKSEEWESIQKEILVGIREVTWPPGNDSFVLHPEHDPPKAEDFESRRGSDPAFAAHYERLMQDPGPTRTGRPPPKPLMKGFQWGNGVVPIRNGFRASMSNLGTGWTLERPLAPELDEVEPGHRAGERLGNGDFVRPTNIGRPFLVEWETGNISSSHRSINKICVLLLRGLIAGGAVVLPDKDTYVYLTDRIGNYEELRSYFLLWENTRITEGVLSLFPARYDALSREVPRIPKGNDGNAVRAMRDAPQAELPGRNAARKQKPAPPSLFD